jgi:GMP synthase (glutamine-hydrolysing)
MKRVLVVRTGSAPPDVSASLGDFTAWFEALLVPRAAAAVVDAERGPLPDPAPYGGILVTGSLSSVTRPEPWMDTLGAWLLRAAERRPVLGVCFGHQLLGRALGGAVERHPRGPEVGTVEVELTDAGRCDPLLAGLPARLAVQEAHEDHVSHAPPGAVVLARTAHTPVQAFAHGPRLRAVQFHPEFDAVRNRAFTEAEREALERAHPGLADAALASIRETPDAPRVVANWLDAFVAG